LGRAKRENRTGEKPGIRQGGKYEKKGPPLKKIGSGEGAWERVGNKQEEPHLSSWKEASTESGHVEGKKKRRRIREKKKTTASRSRIGVSGRQGGVKKKTRKDLMEKKKKANSAGKKSSSWGEHDEGGKTISALWLGRDGIEKKNATEVGTGERRNL